MALQHLRSSTANKRPDPTAMADAQFAINTESTSPGVFFKNSGGNLVKVGPVHIGTTAPNVSPAGQAGNSAGEFWLDTTGGAAELKLYDGSGWVTVGLPIAGGALTGNLTLNAQSDVRFADSDSSNWVAFQAPATIASNVTWTLPNADGTTGQVLSTNGSGALSWTTLAAGASVTTSDTAPVSPDDGDLWYDSVGGRTYVYYDDGNTSQWVDASPQGSGVSDAISEGNTSAEVVDTGTDGHFKVLTEGTERLRVDSSGRVGLGTASPQLSCVISNGGAQGIELTGYNASLGTPLVQYYDRNASAWLDVTHRANGHRFSGPSSEWARIDSSGRLLVGTSTADSFYLSGARTPRLQIRGTGIDNGSLSITRTEAGPAIFLGAQSSGSNVTSGAGLGTLYYTGYHTDGYYIGAAIEAQVDGTPGSLDMPGRLVFSTTADGASSPTERMRIDNAGIARFFGQAGVIYSRSATGAGMSERFYIGFHSATGTTTGGTIAFNVYTNGNVENTNNSYTGISDIKLKENIVDANSQWADIKALRPVNYNFKPETGQQTHTQLGLIAQEVELVCPGLVSESPDRETVQTPILDKNGDPVLDENGDPTFTTEERETGTVTKSVNYSVLYMKAVKALQEAMERIETLEAQNASLEARLTTLEGGN